MNANFIPISTLFLGLNGITAIVLTNVIVMARTRTKLWHGETKEDVIRQPDPFINPNIVAATVEKLSTKILSNQVEEEGALQRKVRAYGNFTEYVPLALLLIIALELMQATWLVWLLGSALTIGRIAHAWGVIKTYGPSPGRAIGFFLTWFVYAIGSIACIYYGFSSIF